MNLLRRVSVARLIVATLVAAFFGSSLFTAKAAFAQDYKVAVLSEAPPSDLSAAVRDTLLPTGLRVTGPSGPICDLWLRKSVPATPNAPQDIGVAFPQIAEGVLVGALRLPETIKDYRRQQIKAGVYTLRHGLTPQNGNHMGVAPQRDFLLAAPAADDQDPANLTIDQTLVISRKATGSGHPSVWSISPAEQNPKALPGIFHLADDDLWLVEFEVSLQGGGPLKMAFVFSGFAPEA